MSKPVVISEMVNSNNERISIQSYAKDNERGIVLCIHDDEPSDIIAPHLLDDETVSWLKTQLDNLEKGKNDDR